MLIKNLANRNLSKRFLLTVNIDNLNAQAGDDPDKLTLLLISAAQLGDHRRYHQILTKMIKATGSLENNEAQKSFKAWIYSRILFAADSMDDQKNVAHFITILKPLLADPGIPQNIYLLQAFANLGLLNSQEYHSIQKQLMDLGVKLNIPWGYVLIALVAAQNKDKQNYSDALAKLKNNQPALSEALRKKFLRNAIPDEYPAWAFSAVMLAAATIIDQKVYSDLKAATLEILEEAKQAGATAEVTIGQITADLAIIRWETRGVSDDLPSLLQ